VDHLYVDDRVDASDVNVEVNNGRVVLTGNVPSCMARRAAGDDAFGILGVRGVHNQLTVLKSVGPLLSDEVIQANAKSVLEWSSDVDASDIRVNVSVGTVSLGGSVVSYWQRTLAERLVANIGGVVDVDNELTIVPTGDVSDEMIAENIESSLRRSPCVSVDDVVVKVAQGVVTLSGTAPSFPALCCVREIVQHTAGVRDIGDNLSIADQ